MCLFLLFFSTTLASRRLQGPAVLLQSPEVESPVLQLCKGRMVPAPESSRGRLRYVVARRVAGVTLVWWRQSRDSDETEKVKQNSCFAMFLCLNFYVSNWYDSVCPSSSLFENQCERCAAG